MKRITCISCLALSLIASGPAMLAQDAAAPFRRASPSPAEATPAPEPAETPREEQEEEPPRRAEPAATPTPASERPMPEQPSAPAPAATASPEEAPKQAPASRTTRRGLDIEPVRPIEPRPPGSRRPRQPEPEGEDKPDDPPKRSRASKPPEREEKPDREAARSQPRTAAGRGATLDYWDEDPGSAVKSLERKWQKALVNKDVDTINDLLARDFVATSSTGKVGSKSTVLNAIRRDKNDYKSADARGMSVRMLGPRVAVVTGIATETGTTPDGKSFRNSRRFTDTWMLRNGKWVCVASQATEVPKG